MISKAMLLALLAGYAPVVAESQAITHPEANLELVAGLDLPIPANGYGEHDGRKAAALVTRHWRPAMVRVMMPNPPGGAATVPIPAGSSAGTPSASG